MKNSIIIPVYNAENFILECLNSVAKQTMFKGLECIVVDDCGTDNSIKLVENFIRIYKGEILFSIIHQDYNQGPSAARNAGIVKATGKYIYFLDADDSITPNCIECLYSLAEKYDADYVQGTYISDVNYKMPVYSESDFPEFTDDKKLIKKTLLNYNIIPFTPHNRLVSHKMIIDNDLFFNNKISVREDFYWMFFIAKHVERMAICREKTYKRGFNPESLTHNINIEREISAYKTLVEDFSENIDPFLSGHQKALILDTLLMILNSGYYHNKEEIKCLTIILKRNHTILENLLFKLYISMDNSWLRTRILHLLIRIYKNND